MLFAQEKKGKEAEKSRPQKTSRNGFEPFVNPEPGRNHLFVNGYNGNFAQQMDLNRKGIEEVLKIAHLDGRVILASLSPLRQRSIEANPDGSVTGKRSLLFGESIEEDQKDNPFLLSRVVAVPQGWKIEINDQKLTEELTGRKLSGKELQRAFIKRFNGQLKETLKECIWREKFSSEKNEYFKMKAFFSLLPILLQVTEYAPLFINRPFYTTFLGVRTIILIYGFLNLLGELYKKVVRNRLRESDPSFSLERFSSFRQNFDSFWEYFMPLVEIDKVARAFAYLSTIGKGRTLIRQTREEK